MRSKDSKRSKARMVYLRPAEIQVPDVRVTSKWEPEMLQMLGESIRADGIQAPLIVVYDGKTHWLVDGLHRLEEARAAGAERVPCAVLDGDLKTVMLRNLYLNRLHGKTPATEMAEVLGELRDNYHMNPAQIAKETGLREEYIEQYLRIHDAEPEVLQRLDQEKIGVGQAAEIARIQNRDVQLRVLAIVHVYDYKLKDTKELVDETLKELAKKPAETTVAKKAEPRPVPTTKCFFDEQQHPIERIRYVPMCMACFGECLSHINRLLQQGWQPVTPAQKTAREIVEATENPGPTPGEAPTGVKLEEGPPHEN